MTRRRVQRRAPERIPPVWTANSFQGAAGPHEHAEVPSGTPPPPRSTFLSRGVLWEVVRTLLEICPDAHNGDGCRYYLRMRAKLNEMPFACCTKRGLCSFFDDVFLFVKGHPDRSYAFIVFKPMVRPIVRNFWTGCVARNDLPPYNVCHQHSAAGPACRDCVPTHPFFRSDE